MKLNISQVFSSYFDLLCSLFFFTATSLCVRVQVSVCRCVCAVPELLLYFITPFCFVHAASKASFRRTTNRTVSISFDKLIERFSALQAYLHI